ncbi:MAG: threonine synthase, partial [Bacilli bacterium]|nr:threonine synthase [Bacilli bacterium]
AARESAGKIDSVTDEEIAEAYRLMALEGVFCEPASAASVAGVLKRTKQSPFNPDDNIVCILTGNGLKDPDSALSRGVHFEPSVVGANLTDVAHAIFG